MVESNPLVGASPGRAFFCRLFDETVDETSSSLPGQQGPYLTSLDFKGFSWDFFSGFSHDPLFLCYPCYPLLSLGLSSYDFIRFHMMLPASLGFVLAFHYSCRDVYIISCDSVRILHDVLGGQSISEDYLVFS